VRVLLVSDVHSNLEAFEEVLNHVSFDKVLFTGDLVDYGPNPVEVFELIQHANAKRVLGNHDAAAAFRTDCRSSSAMHEASVVTRKLITWKKMPQRLLETLGTAEEELQIDYAGLKVRAFHAVPDDKLYRYMTMEEVGQIDMKGADLVVVGHTHVAYEVKQKGVWVVNPGSVGMPKDGDPRASYAVLDTASRSVAFGRASYDIDTVVSKLRESLRKRRDVLDTVATTLKNA
jgi:putative phosphoesterase